MKEILPALLSLSGSGDVRGTSLFDRNVGLRRFTPDPQGTRPAQRESSQARRNHGPRASQVDPRLYSHLTGVQSGFLEQGAKNPSTFVDVLGHRTTLRTKESSSSTQDYSDDVHMI